MKEDSVDRVEVYGCGGGRVVLYVPTNDYGVLTLSCHPDEYKVACDLSNLFSRG
jgi:hypothetical protein